MPEPDETLDAPVYEPPKQGTHWLRWLVVGFLTLSIVCAGLYVLQRPFHPGQHARFRTADLIQNLALACVNFERSHGQYPFAKQDAATATTMIDNRDVYLQLRGLPGARHDYKTDFLGDVRKPLLKDGVLLDSWGHEIQFRVDPKTGQAVIWSCGPNGVDETNDGDSPDPAKFPKGYYWFGQGDTGDDITNL